MGFVVAGWGDEAPCDDGSNLIEAIRELDPSSL